MSARKLGLWSSTSLVVGNMIGSGVFMLPAALAIYKGLGIWAWIAAALGALMLASIFKSLSKRLPHANGGPYTFTHARLGEFPAFLVAWGYWISIWCTNAAIAVAFVSYLSVFIPALNGNFGLSVATGLGAIWLLTWLNTKKIVVSGRMQLITTALKLIPLVLIAVFGLFYINPAHFTWPSDETKGAFALLTEAVTLCLFAFLGLESATIPADNIADPKRTIPRATMLGTGVAVAVYILSSVSVMGMIDPAMLAQSNAPFADAAALLWGEEARYFVAAGALISTFGALNGWILLQGQIPSAAAKDGVFPAIFKRENTHGMPSAGLVISSILASLLMSLNFSKGFAETFKFALLLSTLTALLPYLFSVTSYMILLTETKTWGRRERMSALLAMLTFLFLVWAVAGAGQETVYWGFLLLLSGMPFYAWLKRNVHL